MNFSLIFSLLLITLLCADAFVFGFSYGLDRVKIPPSSMFLISFISGAMLTLSFLFGGRLLTLLPSFLKKPIFPSLSCFFFPFTKFTMPCPPFILRKVLSPPTPSPTKINRKEVQILSLNEAALLAVTLSIDNISVGLSVGTCHLSLFLLLSYSIFIHVVTIWGGWLLGHYFSKRCSHNLSIISALLLLVLAFAQLR